MKRLLKKLFFMGRTRTCSTCAFAYRRLIKGHVSEYTITLCRRYPPRYVSVPMRTAHNRIDTELRVRYPNVGAADSCGEWKKRR